MKHWQLYITLLLSLLFGTLACPAQQLSGVVTDSVTSEPVGYANIYLPRSQRGVLTKENGAFTIMPGVKGDTLEISAVGYLSRRIPLKGVNTSERLKVRLMPRETSLKEIVVRPGKNKYSKKNNPAVELMERVRANAYKSDPSQLPYAAYDSYEKMTLALNDLNLADEKTWLDKKFGFVREYIDTSSFTGKPILNVLIKERITEELAKRGASKRVIRGERSVGIDEQFNAPEITKFLRDVLRDVDIYANDITLMQNKFVSPLSKIGSNYYMYFLTDTLTVGGERCAELSFAPHNPESFGFNGKLYVALNDTTGFVKYLKMQVPKAINLNYIDNLYLEQAFERDPLTGMRKKVRDDMVAEVRIIPGTQSLYARRSITNGNFDYSLTEEEESITAFDAMADEVKETGYDQRDDDFWTRSRLLGLTQKEDGIANLMQRFRQVKFFYWTEKILSILLKGYVPTGNPSKVDLGPVNTIFSYNALEGARFRVGGMTTADLSPHFFLRGYLAYGCKDRKFKYRAEAEYSFNRKKHHSREFPVNGFRLTHEYDVDQIGQHYLFTNPDNIFIALKRKKNDLMTYRRATILEYNMETQCGFSWGLALRHETQQASPFLTFIDGLGTEHRQFRQCVAKLTLRYAPGETFYQMQTDRLPINMDAPVILLTHEFGPKGLLGADFTLNKTELCLQKRFWFSAFGYLDAVVKGGWIWSQVQYPALAWANANLSYTIQPESFALLNPMEFATDKYLNWDITYFANGALFNRIPGVKKLKLREVVAFRGWWGSLADKNNPSLNQDLFRFPTDANVNLMGKKPYMEISAGIDNILTFLRVDYVWRLTYRNHPGCERWGIRAALHFTF